MVLEGATASTETSFADETPTSDLDPYAGDGNSNYPSARASPTFVPVNPPGTEQVFVDLKQFPRPWIFGRISHDRVLTSGIQDSCRMAANIMGRPMRQEEADAFAFHFAKSMHINGWGAPVGMSLAALLAYRGQQKYRFPGYTPPETFNPDKFLVFKGRPARQLWHITRYNAYLFIGVVLGQVFFSSYALTVGMVGRMKDTRLKDFNEAIKERQRAGVKLSVPPRQDTLPGPERGETFDMARQRRSAVETLQRSRGGRQDTLDKQIDDLSPTGGAFGRELQDSGPDSDLLSDSEMKQWESRPEPGARVAASENAAASYGSDTRRRPDSQATSKSQANPAPAPAGSTWEQLRQQASSSDRGSSEKTPVTSASRSSSGGMDAFDFSKDDEERQLARTEAQRDFDARIEREREGKDFDDSRTRGRKL